MKLIVGLGNPGAKYETTRHNAGFLAIDRLVERWKASGPQNREQGECWDATFAGEKVMLIKPQTFMNLSGRCVAPIFRFYKCKPDDLVVLHDELDLKSMSLRLKTGGGPGGHNGLKSLDESIGDANYHRVRIGIGRPEHFNIRMNPVDWVLHQYSDAELQELDGVLEVTADAVEALLREGISAAMNRFNKR